MERKSHRYFLSLVSAIIEKTYLPYALPREKALPPPREVEALVMALSVMNVIRTGTERVA